MALGSLGSPVSCWWQTRKRSFPEQGSQCHERSTQGAEGKGSPSPSPASLGRFPEQTTTEGRSPELSEKAESRGRLLCLSRCLQPAGSSSGWRGNPQTAAPSLGECSCPTSPGNAQKVRAARARAVGQQLTGQGSVRSCPCPVPTAGARLPIYVISCAHFKLVGGPEMS